tara:strand:+ start:656 stop:865 length:210 start_codon:yes stop_codon:yes gene_type:complete
VTTKDNVIQFPRTIEHINRDMNRIVDDSVDIVERSEALLRWAKQIDDGEYLYELNDGQLRMSAIKDILE